MLSFCLPRGRAAGHKATHLLASTAGAASQAPKSYSPEACMSGSPSQTTAVLEKRSLGSAQQAKDSSARLTTSKFHTPPLSSPEETTCTEVQASAPYETNNEAASANEGVTCPLSPHKADQHLLKLTPLGKVPGKKSHLLEPPSFANS